MLALRADLEAYLQETQETAAGRVTSAEVTPEQTTAFRRVMGRAAARAQASGKKRLELGDVLAALSRESNSQAA